MRQGGAIAIYSRKSKFTGKGESIGNQIELCKQYIGVHDGDAAASAALVYEDEGFSGGNLERPQFKKMMDDAKAGKISAIIVYRLDRISRNIGDFATLIQKLNDMKISFVSIKEQFDTSSPMGRAMMYIASVFSQLERETIAERIRDNMRELAKTGRWLGGITPTGYSSEQVQRVSVDGKVRKACKLKTVPEEAEIVKAIFDKFLETTSLTKTDAYLLQNGYTTKNGNSFSRFTIKGILSNPVYMAADEEAYQYLSQNEADVFSDVTEFDGKHGVIAYNRTSQKTGKSNKIRPMSEWIVSVGRHSGIITGAQWIKVQSLLEQNRAKSYRKPRSNVALLSGLLFCGNCGDYMRPKLSSRVDAHGERLYTYLCTMKERSRSRCCNGKNVSGNTLDRIIIEEIKKLPTDNSEFVRQVEKSKKSFADNGKGHQEELDKLNAQLSENEEKIKALVTALTKASGTAAEEYIVKQIDELHDNGTILQRRAEEAKQLAASREVSNVELDMFLQMLSSFEDAIDGVTVEQKRAAIRACVKKVVWDGERIHLYLFGSEGKADLPDLPATKMPLGEDSK